MSRERKAKRVDFEQMKRLSRLKGLARGPHARKVDRAKIEHEKQQTRELARWYRATLIHARLNISSRLQQRIACNFLRAFEKG